MKKLKLPKIRFKFPKTNGQIKRLLIKKSPEILTFVGTIGMAAGTIIAVTATPKAMRLIEEKKEEKGGDLTPIEVVKTTWKCYIPSATTIAISAACICSGNHMHVKRNAALTTACAISTQALSEYKSKVKEVIGEKKTKIIEDKIAEDKVNKNPVTNNEVIITRNNTHLCYDAITGRYFKSDIESIKRAINELNRDMVQEMYISLNEFYSMIGLPSVAIGDNIGWNIDDGFIDISFSSLIADNGEPCIVISADIAPRWDYRDLR